MKRHLFYSKWIKEAVHKEEMMQTYRWVIDRRQTMCILINFLWSLCIYQWKGKELLQCI